MRTWGFEERVWALSQHREDPGVSGEGINEYHSFLVNNADWPTLVAVFLGANTISKLSAAGGEEKGRSFYLYHLRKLLALRAVTKTYDERYRITWHVTERGRQALGGCKVSETEEYLASDEVIEEDS